MIDQLIELMIDQEKDLKELLSLLKTQNEMIIKKDLFGLEGLVDKLNECSKRIAKAEMQRRKLLGKDSIAEIVKNSKDGGLKQSYKNIRDTLRTVLSQKETNDMLLKQQLLFSNKMLNIINPDRRIKTYNSYGNLSR
jgi:flagellar biosynthesis/type III secretory pathway chaperone